MVAPSATATVPPSRGFLEHLVEAGDNAQRGSPAIFFRPTVAGLDFHARVAIQRMRGLTLQDRGQSQPAALQGRPGLLMREGAGSR